MIIKDDIDLYGNALNIDEEEEDLDDKVGVVMIKDGYDIFRSAYLSLLLISGIILGIFGVIMSISVIYGWYKA